MVQHGCWFWLPTSWTRLVHVAFFSLAHLTDDMLFLHYLKQWSGYMSHSCAHFLWCNCSHPLAMPHMSSAPLQIKWWLVEMYSAHFSEFVLVMVSFLWGSYNHPFYHTCVLIVQYNKTKQMMTIWNVLAHFSTISYFKIALSMCLNYLGL